MPPNKTIAAPWQALEEQAFHAYREWPIWLVLRERELAARTTPDQATPARSSLSLPVTTIQKEPSA
jgi:hypothetical protein